MATPVQETSDFEASDDVATAVSGTDHLFRVLTVALVPLASLVIFIWMYQPISDPDTFWHLRLGEYLSTTWAFSGPEPWSSLATRPLVFHEWAPQLAYFTAFRTGGYAAVAWLQAVGAVVLFLTLYACGRTFAPAVVSTLTAVAGFVGAVGSVSARPQMVTFVLLAVFTTAWMWTARDGRARWWLVPLTWVWACSHGMWFIGPGIGMIVILGMLADRTIGLRGAAHLSLVPLSGVALAALTPVGPRLLLTSGAMSDYTRHVGEWQPPSVFAPQSVVALALAVSVLLLLSRTPGRVAWTELGLWMAGLALILMYARTVALGSIIMSILAASVLARRVTMSEGAAPPRRLEVLVVTLGTVAAIAIGPALAAADVSRPAGVPVALDPALRALPAGTVVFNDYSLGGWLLWAHPNLDPVIDGRADVYDVDYFNETITAYDVPQGWQDTLRARGATAAVLPSASPLAEGLRSTLGWTSLGEDEGFELLVPPS